MFGIGFRVVEDDDSATLQRFLSRFTLDDSSDQMLSRRRDVSEMLKELGVPIRDLLDLERYVATESTKSQAQLDAFKKKIHAAYRNAVRRLHPDVSGGDTTAKLIAVKKFDQWVQAWTIGRPRPRPRLIELRIGIGGERFVLRVRAKGGQKHRVD